MTSSLVETIAGVLERGEDADRVLEDAVTALAAEPGIMWAGIAFVEDEELALGPAEGEADESRRICVPITYDGDTIGELRVDGEAERPVLDQVAALLAPYVLIGWDTRGEPWVP